MLLHASRRDFMVCAGAAALGFLPRRLIGQSNVGPLITFGVVADCHYADIPTGGSRYYRESDEKLSECVSAMNAAQANFLVEVGDFKDQGGTATETLEFLRGIENVYAGFKGARYHVLGNHDMDRISKSQFLGEIENTGIATGRTFYSFDRQGVHFVVLDANFRADGSDYDSGNFDWTESYVPQHELDWLADDLASSAPLPTVVFVHQLLDADVGAVYVRNAAAVRAVLEACGRVCAVFQGHHHAGGHQVRNGIHYVTQKAVVEGTGAENNAYSLVSFYADGRLDITGFRRADSFNFFGAPVTAAGASSSYSGATMVDTRTGMREQTADKGSLDMRTFSVSCSVPRALDTRRRPGTLFGVS